MEIQALIDNETEKLLEFILNKYVKFDEFLKEIKSIFINEELLYDNILKSNENYDIFFKSYSIVYDKYCYNPYKLRIDENLLLELNKLINNEFGYRDRNIIHRHFLHEIFDYTRIENKTRELFEKFENNNYTVLENYIFLTYNLYKIYPFFNALAIRLIGNLYLLKNDYLPVILSVKNKSDYYYVLQYDFNRFREVYFEFILKNLKNLGKILGYKNEN